MQSDRAVAPSRRSLWDAAPLLLLCLLPILLYLPFLGTPFERDEGVYATIAQGLLDGHMPYRDLFDNKPPLVYGWYAFSFMLFGETVVAPRIVAAVLLSLTTLSVFGHARMLFPKRVAYFAAALFGISTGLPFVALHANTEAYMLLPLVTSLVAFTIGIRRGRLHWFFLSGALGAVAMMTKQVAIWNLIALAVVALGWHWRSVGLSCRAAVPALCLVAGAALSAALIAVPFALTGSLDDLFYATVSYNWLYVAFLSQGERLLNLGAGLLFFFAVAAPLVGAALMGLLIILRRRSSAADVALILWALASAVGVSSGGRFFPHYFLQAIPVLALLASVAIYYRLRERHVHPVRRPAMILGAMLVLVSLGTNAALYVAPRAAEERVAPTVHEQKQWEEASKALGTYIAERTRPGDAIFNYGRESQIYFYADRPPAIRFFYDWAVEYDPNNLPKMIAALQQALPVYVIDSAQPPLFEDYRRYHPAEFTGFLEEHYEYAGRIYFADVYRLKTYRPLQPEENLGLEFNLLVTKDNPF